MYIGEVILIVVKVLFKLVFKAMLGGLVLIALNFICKLLNFHIAINVITSLIVGFMGAPGVALLIALKVLLKIP